MRLFSESDVWDVCRWVERARGGDHRAWDAIVDRFKNLVYSVARRCGLDANDAEDAFQATFVALYRNLDRIENPETLGKWLSVTAARESLKMKRIASKTVNEDPDGSPLEEILADEESTAEVQALAAMESDYWRRALVRLGGRCEVLLTALYFEERSYEEIVATLGIPSGAIGPTRSRCLEKLRKMYHAERGEDS